MRTSAPVCQAVASPRCARGRPRPYALIPEDPAGPRSWALASDRKPVVAVERGDHRDAQHGERGAGRAPIESQASARLEALADSCRARGVERLAEQPVTARVLPDGVKRQRRQVERDAVEDDGRSLAVFAPARLQNSSRRVPESGRTSTSRCRGPARSG
jgi:hypothetical protein